MANLDKNARDVLKKIYLKFEKRSEFSVSSPEYDKLLIDYLIEQGLLEKIDASTFNGWEYIIRPTYTGKKTISNLNSSKVEAFIARGEAIMKEEYHQSEFASPAYISGPKSDQWFSEISIFNARALKDHPLHNQIDEVCKKHNRSLSAHDDMMGYLRALLADDELDEEIEEKENTVVTHKKKTIAQMIEEDIERCEIYLSEPKNETFGKKLYLEITSRYDSIIPNLGYGLYHFFAEQHFYDPDISGESLLHNLQVIHEKMISYQAQTHPPVMYDSSYTVNSHSSVDNKKVFIVHGHDNEAKQELARVLERAGFEAIILHEQPNSGKTIIEKIECYTDVDYAIVLYTECDIGRDKNATPDQERFRARQNVVFEHGYLIAKLGRERVCALVKGNVEIPGDISGIVYITMAENGAWKMNLANNMQDVGLSVDMEKFCR